MDRRICYVVNSVSETSVPATLATALVDYEDVMVDILAWFDASSFEGDDRVGVTCLDAPESILGIDRETYRAARRYLSEYDLLQAHHPHSGSIAKLIGHRLGCPMVSREGNMREGFTRKGRIANGLTNGLADRIVPNSRAVYESFTTWERVLINDEDVQIIPNGVDLDRIERAQSDSENICDSFDIPTESIVVGTAALLTEQKAIDVLIEGIARANEQMTERLDLVVAGDGPLRTDLEQLAGQLDIDEHVHFAGRVDRDTVYRILGEIDIYAMPSRWEGFANAAVEALGAGKPCVFSEIDPFLLPYRNVALFHRIDDIGDFADRLVELATDAELRELYGSRGRKLVEKEYRLEHVAGQYAELYFDLF